MGTSLKKPLNFKGFNMSAFWKLALKNVFRNRRRTIITTSIITFGIVSLFFSYGFIDFSFEGLKERTIRQGVGHIQIFHPDYNNKFEERALEYGISNPDTIIKDLLFDEDVRFTMKRIEFNGLISNGDKSEIFIGRGIEPKLEEKLSSVFVTRKDGKLLSQKQGNDFQVIIGYKLAEKLNAKIGDYLTILSTTSYGAQNAIDLKLVGTYTTGIPQIDERQIMIDLKAAQVLIDTEKITKLIVVLNETNKSREKLEEFSLIFSNFELKSWEDLAPFYKGVVNLYTSAFGLLSFIILFIVILAIVNTTVMSISERTKEIGTLQSIGTGQKRLLLNFLYEGISISLLGVLTAIISGAILISIINISGFTMPPPPGSSSGYPLMINIVPMMWLKISLSIILVAVISAIIPAYKASRMNIVESLGHI